MTIAPDAIYRCRDIRHVALDMDGTIYLGDQLFEWTPAFLQQLREMGITYSFLTNNPTRSRQDYVDKLRRMGIEATEQEMFTSAVATIEYLKAHQPHLRTLFLTGTSSMKAEFEAAGYQILPDDTTETPDALILAFDTTLTYERLCRAAWWASRGVPYIATNPDKVCPTPEETILVDCGSLAACIAMATGRQPDVVIGKPSPDMLQAICDRFGYKPSEVAMCGDRLYTDMDMARRAGALSVLVLSGETPLDAAIAANPRPEVIVDTIADFGALLQQSRLI